MRLAGHHVWKGHWRKEESAVWRGSKADSLVWLVVPAIYKLYLFIFPNGATAPSGPGPPRCRSFTITHSDTAHSVGRLWTSDRPVAQTSTWRHTTLTRDILAPVGFEPTILSSVRPQTHALDSAATGIGLYILHIQICSNYILFRIKRNSLNKLALVNSYKIVIVVVFCFKVS